MRSKEPTLFLGCFLFFTILTSNAALLSPDAEPLLKVKGIRDGETEREKYELLQDLRKRIKNQEDELEKTEKMNKNFERLVQFVNILGQIDSFLSERTKNVIKKLAALTREEDEELEEFESRA